MQTKAQIVFSTSGWPSHIRLGSIFQPGTYLMVGIFGGMLLTGLCDGGGVRKGSGQCKRKCWVEKRREDGRGRAAE